MDNGDSKRKAGKFDFESVIVGLLLGFLAQVLYDMLRDQLAGDTSRFWNDSIAGMLVLFALLFVIFATPEGKSLFRNPFSKNSTEEPIRTESKQLRA